MNQFRKIYTLVTIIGLFFTQLLVSEVKAASVEGLLNLPWSSATSTIQDQNIETVSQDVAFEVQSIPIKLDQVKTQVLIQFDPLKVHGNQTILSTKNLNIRIETSPFQVKKDIVKQIDGRNVIIHLEASCGAVQFSQNAAF